ncbi:MAG: hypothetical protein WBF12_14555 [Bradyrhizobium sp.]
MLSNDRKLRAALIFASTMLAAGLVLCGFSVVTTTRTNVHLAQATPPSQGSPSTTTNDKPAESKPGGTRPTTPAPEPARPDAQAQKEGAKAALPPAPPEKIAPPMEKK